MPSTIGRAMRRLEDPRLITGQGRYAGDIQLPNLAHLVFVRSSQPHASIRSVDVEAARHDIDGLVAALLDDAAAARDGRGRPARAGEQSSPWHLNLYPTLRSFAPLGG